MSFNWPGADSLSWDLAESTLLIMGRGATEEPRKFEISPVKQIGPNPHPHTSNSWRRHIIPDLRIRSSGWVRQVRHHSSPFTTVKKTM
jgi:hypothetical protein